LFPLKTCQFTWKADTYILFYSSFGHLILHKFYFRNSLHLFMFIFFQWCCQDRIHLFLQFDFLEFCDVFAWFWLYLNFSTFWSWSLPILLNFPSI
jgi:hypothetical protein